MSDDTKNILLLGSTGVGKSTLINSITNMLKFESFEQLVEKRKMDIVIRGQFDHHDVNMMPTNVRFDSNVKRRNTQTYNVKRDNNIQADITQMTESFVYETQLGNFRFIDTPGMGDVRGPAVDKKNIDNIMNYITQYRNLHGIVLVISNDNSRLNNTFRYTIQELLLNLHRSAIYNIFFVFTYTMVNNYHPGDSLKTLRVLLGDLRNRHNIEVPTRKTNIFCVDNVWFRWAIGQEKGIELPESFEGMEECFNKNKEEITRFLLAMNEIEPHQTMETVSIHKVRNVIHILHRPLATMAHTMQKNVAHGKPKSRVSNGKVNVEQMVVLVIENRYPSTQCTAPQCTKVVTDEKGVKRNIYTVCHDQCYVPGIQEESLNIAALDNCEAFNYKAPFQCFTCGCQTETHMHMRYELRPQTILKSVDANQDNPDEILASLYGQDQQELTKVKECCSEFAVFVKQNAVGKTNDAFEDYMDFLFKSESNHRNDPQVIQQLRQMLEEHRRKVAILENTAKDNRSQAKSAHEINEMLQELYTLRTVGPVLTRVFNLEMGRLSNEAVKFDAVVMNYRNGVY